MTGHALAELRSLALHRAVAKRLLEDGGVLERARARVARWRSERSVHPHYCAAWEEILSLPLDRLLASILDEGERARDLRQVSPFAGALEPRERWRVLRSITEST